jgi:hypothetical protein
MSDWGYVHSGQITEDAGAVTATSMGTTPATPGSAHTKGAWTQLIASSAYDAIGVIVQAFGDSSVGTFLLDIGVGGSGSEVPVIENLHFQRLASSYGGCGQPFIPLLIPAGTRVSMRLQASVTAAVPQTRVACQLVAAGGGTPIFGRRCATYGAVTASSKGTTVTASGSTHTKGSWAEITSSAAISSEWCVLSVHNDGTNGKHNLIDIAVGAASSEQVIVSNLYMPAAQTYQLTGGKHSFPLHIPAGSRVAVRAQSDVANAAFSVSMTVSG